MKHILLKYKKWIIPIAIAVFLGGLALIWSGLRQSVLVVVDKNPQQIRTAALTTQGMLRAAGVEVQSNDIVYPIEKFVWEQPVIKVKRAKSITIETPENTFHLETIEVVPANLLKEVGINIFPKDRVLVDGLEVDPNIPLNLDENIVLHYVPAIQLNVVIDGDETRIFTDQTTLGKALELAGIEIGPQDWTSEALTATLSSDLTLEVRRARQVTVQAGEVSHVGMTAANAVGEALLDLGVALQNLDFSIPPEDAPVPDPAQIEVVRVNEAMNIATEETPYESVYEEDPQTPLDQYSVIEPGQNAIFATRERVTYENGEETWRTPAESWQASEGQKGIMGYGTQVVVQTEVVDGQTIEYWRKLSVYATSYKPCDANGVCHDGTAGGYPLQQGIIAVSPHWYSVPNGLGMADLPVYVPGYGYAIIGDVCGGCSNEYWIDLAYREENYIPWYHWTTMYFLTPVPAYYPAIITP